MTHRLASNNFSIINELFQRLNVLLSKSAAVGALLADKTYFISHSTVLKNRQVMEETICNLHITNDYYL